MPSRGSDYRCVRIYWRLDISRAKASLYASVFIYLEQSEVFWSIWGGWCARSSNDAFGLVSHSFSLDFMVCR